MKFLCLLTVLIAASLARAELVWWEGESPVSTNFPPNSPLSSANFKDRADLLSGGQWLSTAGKRTGEPLTATYSVHTNGGDYHLWVRKFWQHGPFKWHFDDQPVAVCDRSKALVDDVSLAKFINADWVSLGDVKLSAGDHTFKIELLADVGEETTCGIDCFVLSTDLFVPNGINRPGVRTGKADDGYFAWEPPIDSFTADAAVDLRSLNEPVAGGSGPVRVVDGHFSVAGKPTRFWGVNVSNNNAAQDHATVDYLARKLAKLGVNLVRFHGPLFDHTDASKIDPRQLDHLMYLQSALKKQGIYLYISFYYPMWLDGNNPALGLTGFDQIASKPPLALLYFDPHVQDLWKGWAKQILTPVNPYTGTSLAADPAVAVVETVNEDSLLFWTLSRKSIPPNYWRSLEDQFTQWAVAKYGSVSSAKAAWIAQAMPQDSADHLGLFEAYGMTSRGSRQVGERRQVRFLAETQKGWYAAAKKYLKQDLKLAGLVNSSNWFACDGPLLDAVERWTVTAGDISDRHGYFNPAASGDGIDYSVRAGHTFTSRASIQMPDSVPIRVFKTDGMPHLISEIGWTNPTRTRADCTFLCAAYGSLQDIDGLGFFMVGSDYLNDTSVGKFGLGTPVIAGSFLAAALVYRRGDVSVGSPVVKESLQTEHLFDMKPTLAWGGGGTGGTGGVDDLATYVGPVSRRYDQISGALARSPEPQIDRDHSTVSSNTGQLVWNYKSGLATVNTPTAQGAAGFLSAAGEIALGDVTITCGNRFAAVWVVSLDGQPIATSKKLLVQATTTEQPFGFKTAPAANNAERIVNLGASPMTVERLKLTLKWNVLPKSVTPLDENGYPKPGTGVVEDATSYLVTR